MFNIHCHSPKWITCFGFVERSQDLSDLIGFGLAVTVLNLPAFIGTVDRTQYRNLRSAGQGCGHIAITVTTLAAVHDCHIGVTVLT